MKYKMYNILDLEELIGLRPVGFRMAFRGGSREIVDPPVMDTDLDICILVQDVDNTVPSLERRGFTTAGSDYDGEYGDFVTMRRGDFNLLLFSNSMEFGAVMAATRMAKYMNVQSKSERYRLFEVARSFWRPVP